MIAILSTSIGTLYTDANVDIVAQRCCCKEKKKKMVYETKSINGKAHKENLMIDLRGLFLAAATDRKLFSSVVSEITDALEGVFSEAINELNSKQC